MLTDKSKEAVEKAKDHLELSLKQATDHIGPADYRSYLLLRGITLAFLAVLETA